MKEKNQKMANRIAQLKLDEMKKAEELKAIRDELKTAVEDLAKAEGIITDLDDFDTKPETKKKA